jgi:hypothetical protein
MCEPTMLNGLDRDGQRSCSIVAEPIRKPDARLFALGLA